MLNTFESISSPRLILRSVDAGDLPDLMKANGDPEVTRFLPYPAWQTEKDAQAWLSRMEELMSTGAARQLVMVKAADQKVIGSVLLFKFDEGSRRLEIGYVLGRAHWRQGYAKEALGVLLCHLMTEVGIRRIEAEVNPKNIASNALLTSLGFKHEGLLRDRWMAESSPYSVNIYGLLATDFSVAADSD